MEKLKKRIRLKAKEEGEKRSHRKTKEHQKKNFNEGSRFRKEFLCNKNISSRFLKYVEVKIRNLYIFSYSFLFCLLYFLFKIIFIFLVICWALGQSIKLIGRSAFD